MSVESMDKPSLRSEADGGRGGEQRVNRPAPRYAPEKQPQGGGGGSHWWVWLIFLVIMGAAGYGIYKWWTTAQARAHAQATAAGQTRGETPVRAAVVRRGDFPIYYRGLGTVTAFNSIVVRTRVDGELLKYHFVEGQTVHENDVIAEIDARPYEAQRTQAQGQKARDEALLKSAQQDVEKYTQAGEAVAKQLLDTAVATVGQYEGAVKSDQGMIDSAELQIKYCQILAPLTGQIGLQLIDPGNMVHAADANGLAVITQVEPISVVFSLSEDSLPQVMKAMRANAELEVEAWSHDLSTKLATGKLFAIDNQIDPTTLMVRFKANFDNKDHALFTNQAVNARVLVDTKKDVLLIPSSAVQRNAKGETFAYVVTENSTVEVRPIKLSDTEGLDPSEGEVTPIAEGVEAGEQVVTDGMDKLQPGAKVTVREGTSTQPATDAATQPGQRGRGGRGGRGGRSRAATEPATSSAAASAPATRGGE